MNLSKWDYRITGSSSGSNPVRLIRFDSEWFHQPNLHLANHAKETTLKHKTPTPSLLEQYWEDIDYQSTSLESRGHKPTILLLSPEVAHILGFQEFDSINGLEVRFWDRPEDKLELVVLPRLLQVLLLKRVS